MVIIECVSCESKVDGVVKGEVRDNDPDYPFPCKRVLVQCPVCGSALLGITEQIQVGHDEWEWDSLHRIWPPQDSQINWEIPEIARNSLIEAKTCFKAKAFSACAVMCGRAIEGVCKHHNAKTKSLAAGLKDLRDNNIIDSRIFEWGEALRTARNLGAHASTEKVSKEDARDLLDFCIAICDYVFVLNSKFERFKARQNEA
ncbi:DUF4145 domain-containing protein [Vibrio parahaemolyticus]|nr:DUF4145 domain-containing protein [Vibrio parahaemolyticus]EJG1834006.1 DUF4145 domain-containing protein [Vibrio parahaemolyticus]MBE3871767.1 DUF4145 domain-containing protein [Vibrio parahaemolyticus]HAS6952661.1 DUF4145 domain-containing protein [Vibrio parahaemolyticus]